MRHRVASPYDRLARWYHLLSLPERSLQRRAVALLAPTPGERVLAVGSGTGHELAGLAKAGAYAFGVDRSWGMCRRAQARLARGILAARAAPVQADALHLPLAASSCDAALLVLTLELFAAHQMPSMLAELARVLRPGGRLVVACLSRRHLSPMVRLYEALHRRWPRWVDCRPILAVPLLHDQGWRVALVEARSLGGLPVDIVLASRPEPGGAPSPP